MSTKHDGEASNEKCLDNYSDLSQSLSKARQSVVINGSSLTSSDASASDDKSLFAETSTKLPVAEVELNKRKIKFLVDSGSLVTIIDRSTHAKIGYPALVQSNHTFSAESTGKPLALLGKFKAKLTKDDGKMKTSVYVVDNEKSMCILSLSASEKIHLLKLDPSVPYVYYFNKPKIPFFISELGKHAIAEVELNNIKIKFFLDSGACSTTIDRNTHAKIGSPKLKQTQVKIFPYMEKEPLPFLGEFEATIVRNEIRVRTTVFVKNSSKLPLCVLSRTASEKIGLLKLDQINVTYEYTGISQKLEKIGEMQGFKLKLDIDESVPPVAQPREIPHNLRSTVEAQIVYLEQMDLIEKVSSSMPTPWVSPIIYVLHPDSKDSSLICVDMRAANQSIRREHHTIHPTVRGIIQAVHGSKFFTKLVLCNNWYNQIELAEESRYVTTFSTHIGLRRYKRMIPEILFAQEIFHSTIRELLSDLDGVTNSSNDILVYGVTKEELLLRTKAVEERLRQNNLTINIKKRKDNQKQIEFFGMIISRDGVRVDPQHIKAIKDLREPNANAEVMSFLSLTDYFSRTISNYYSLTKPLRELIKEEGSFIWTDSAKKAFENLKSIMSSSSFLSFFDLTLHTELIVDASEVGFGAILIQRNNRNEPNIVAFASKALTANEKLYQELDREALAIVWAIEHFRTYTSRKSFKVLTDHHPLEALFNEPMAILTPTIESFIMRKQAFDMLVEYTPGQTSAADYLSKNFP